MQQQRTIKDGLDDENSILNQARLTLFLIKEEEKQWGEAFRGFDWPGSHGRPSLNQRCCALLTNGFLITGPWTTDAYDDDDDSVHTTLPST